MSKILEIEKDLAKVLNQHGVDSMSGVPDYILASYLVTCIAALKAANKSIHVHEGNNKENK